MPQLPMTENYSVAECNGDGLCYPGQTFRSLGAYHNDFIFLSNAIDYPSTLPGPKLAAGDFSAPGICSSAFNAPNCWLPFVANIQQGGWMQQVDHSSKSQSIVDHISATGLTHVRTFTAIRSPRGDPLPVG